MTPLLLKHLTRLATICLPTPVIVELLFAARNSTYQKENLKVYNEFINACTVLNITRETANLYSIIRLELKQKGRPIPENDLWIASICKEQNLPLFTGDAHFDTRNGLRSLICNVNLLVW